MLRLLFLLLILLPGSLMAQQEQIGAFTLHRQTNPATGETRQLIVTFRKDGSERLGAVAWGCSMNGLTGMLMTEAFEDNPDSVQVSLQFPPWPESDPVSWAGFSADGKTASWTMPADLVRRIRVEAEGKVWLTVTVASPVIGETLKTTFGFWDFREAIGHLPCVQGG